jgi:tetratricopeptide (TPR) repeat protein
MMTTRRTHPLEMLCIIILVLCWICAAVTCAQENEAAKGCKALAEKSFAERDYRQALEKMRLYLKAYPRDHTAHQMCALCLVQLGSYDAAEKSAKTALLLHSGDFISARMLGVIYMKKGDMAKAMKYFSLSASINTDYPDAHLGMGEVFLRKKEPEKARHAFKLAKEAAITPEIKLWKAIAERYMEAGLYNDAIFTYREFLQEHPEEGEVHFLLAKAFLKKGDPQAEGALRKAIDCEPRNPLYRETYGDFLAKAKKYSEAVKEYEKAASLGKVSPMTHYRLGLLSFQKGDKEKAIRYLEKAVQGKPDLLNAHLALSSLYLGKGDYRECLDHCALILKLQPDNDTAYYNGACALAQTRKSKEALASLRKAIELVPDNKKIARDENLFKPLRDMKEFRELTD